MPSVEDVHRDQAACADQTVRSFQIGDVVQHIFHGRYGTVEKVGRSKVHVRIHPADRTYSFLPTSLRKVN